MSTIHPAWLRPMPRYWNDFSDRDSPLLDDPVQDGPRLCAMCSEPFELRSKFATSREICYRAECMLQRKRRNRNASARRVRMRRMAQRG